jgi:hypothetical protein
MGSAALAGREVFMRFRSGAVKTLTLHLGGPISSALLLSVLAILLAEARNELMARFESASPIRDVLAPDLLFASKPRTNFHARLSDASFLSRSG